MRTLLLFSGGLDSTAALIKLLRETKDELTVHHVRLVTKQNRHDAEGQAVRAIIAEAKKIRKFKVTTSGFHCTEILRPPDVLTTRFLGSLAAGKHRCRQIATGRVKDDDTLTYSRRLERANKMAEAMQCGAEWVFPIQHMTKQECFDYLKEHCPEVLPMVWYCRTPKMRHGQWRNCTHCPVCKQVANTVPELWRMGS